MALTESMKQALMDRVDSYGNRHTLRCLALASRPLPPSNEPVLPRFSLLPPMLGCRRNPDINTPHTFDST